MDDVDPLKQKGVIERAISEEVLHKYGVTRNLHHMDRARLVMDYCEKTNRSLYRARY